MCPESYGSHQLRTRWFSIKTKQRMKKEDRIGQFLLLCSSVRHEWHRDETTFFTNLFSICFYLFPSLPSFPWGFNSSPSTMQLGVQCIRKIVSSGVCYLTFSTRMIFLRYKKNIYNKKEGKSFIFCRCCWYMKTKTNLTFNFAFSDLHP